MKIKLVSIGRNKIRVVKLVKTISGLGLKESKDIADKPNSVFEVVLRGISFADIERKFNTISSEIELISDDKLETPDIINEAKEEDIEKSDNIYIITIQSQGHNLLNSIKIIRKYSGLGIKECKDLLENLPSEFTTKLPENQLSELKYETTMHGIECKIKEKSVPVGATYEEEEDIIRLKIIVIDARNKILLIKTIREFFEMGLREAKKIVDKPNSIFYCKIPESILETIKTAFAESKDNIVDVAKIYDYDYVPRDAFFVELIKR